MPGTLLFVIVISALLVGMAVCCSPQTVRVDGHRLTLTTRRRVRVIPAEDVGRVWLHYCDWGPQAVVIVPRGQPSVTVAFRDVDPLSGGHDAMCTYLDHASQQGAVVDDDVWTMLCRSLVSGRQ